MHTVAAAFGMAAGQDQLAHGAPDTAWLQSSGASQRCPGLRRRCSPSRDAEVRQTIKEESRKYDVPEYGWPTRLDHPVPCDGPENQETPW